MKKKLIMNSLNNQYTEKDVCYFLERLVISMPVSSYSDTTSLNDLIITLGRDISVSLPIREIITKIDINYSIIKTTNSRRYFSVFDEMYNAGLFKPFVMNIITENRHFDSASLKESFDTIVKLYKQELDAKTSN
jgi:hypothetical protein